MSSVSAAMQEYLAEALPDRLLSGNRPVYLKPLRSRT